jgi:hypothetical protein
MSSRRKSVSFRHRDVAKVPDGPWCWFSLEMMTHPAFRGLSLPARRFIDFLEIELMHHAGFENGRLVARYDDLVAFGIRRDVIRRAIDEVVDRGLVEITSIGLYGGSARNAPARYELTFRPTDRRNPNGVVEWLKPADYWRAYQPSEPQRGRRDVANGSKLNSPQSVTRPVTDSVLRPVRIS